MATGGDYDLRYYRPLAAYPKLTLFLFGSPARDGFNQIFRAQAILREHNLHLSWYPPYLSPSVSIPWDGRLPPDKFFWLLEQARTLLTFTGRLPVFIGQTETGNQGETMDSFPAVIIDPFAVNDTTLLHEMGHKAGLHHPAWGLDYTQDQKDVAETGVHNFMCTGGAGGNMWKKQVEAIATAWFSR